MVCDGLFIPFNLMVSLFTLHHFYLVLVRLIWDQSEKGVCNGPDFCLCDPLGHILSHGSDVVSDVTFGTHFL